MPNDIDILMSYIHEINAKPAAEVTDLDIDRLVAYHRHNRARRAAGYKPAKPDKPKVDVLGLLQITPKPKLPPGSSGTVRRL